MALEGHLIEKSWIGSLSSSDRAFDCTFAGSKCLFDELWRSSWSLCGAGSKCVRLSACCPRRCTTADSENRIRDKANLQARLGLQEEGVEDMVLCDARGNVLATGFVQVLFGDHGDYFELLEQNVNWSIFVRHKLKGPDRHYHEHYTADGIQLYDQFRTVEDEPNPPPGPKSMNNNRQGGYADYKPGCIYLSADLVASVHKDNPLQRPAVQHLSAVDNTLLFNEGEFSYHVLTQTHRDEVLMLLSRAFVTEPVCSAVAEIKPSMRTDLKDWVEFVDYWMDHCSSNGLSVFAYDRVKLRVAGAFIVRDLLMVPEGFDDAYGIKNDALTQEPIKTLAPWMQFLWHMDAEATKILPELGEAGKAVDLWFLGVHPDYRGNGIANHLTRGVLPLVKKAGFSSATIEATSAFTSKAATFNKFSKVYEMEAKDWLYKGKPLYVNAAAPHGTWTFWVKDLSTVENGVPSGLPVQCQAAVPSLLFREDKFSYHMLTPVHRDEVLMLLSRAFVTEPVCSAVAEVKPSMRTHLKDWVEFVDYWMDHCSSNGLSVIAIDEVSGRVAGAFIVRDLLMVPDGFDDAYGVKYDALTEEPVKTLAPWMQFLWHMDAEATKIMPELGEAGKAVDLWFLGVHPDYRGNGIANHLIRGVLPLVKKAGFSYATIEATSAFTSKAATFNEFSKVYEMEAKDWKYKGKPLYVNAAAPHGTWTFWVKDLDGIVDN